MCVVISFWAFSYDSFRIPGNETVLGGDVSTVSNSLLSVVDLQNHTNIYLYIYIYVDSN